jgi:antitoxin (DNA-binding transcriptional repressor) of toxin-antitoxin stability system
MPFPSRRRKAPAAGRFVVWPHGILLTDTRTRRCYNRSMSTINFQELQQDPSSLLDRVEAGEHFVVVRGGRPVAELRPVAPVSSGQPRPFGLAAGVFSVPDDFDAPLPDEVLREFEGR